MGQKRAAPKECLSNPRPPQIADRIRNHALFNMAVDSKLRGCNLVRPVGNP
jgi:hypothetical protein